MCASPRPTVHARLAAAVSGAAILGTVVLSGSAWAGNLSCQTVNGHTLCLHGSGSMRCTTVGDRTDCYLDAGSAALPDLSRPRPVRPPLPGLPGPSEPQVRPAIPDPLSPGGGVEVERGPDGLRVRVDGLEVRMP